MASPIQIRFWEIADIQAQFHNLHPFDRHIFLFAFNVILVILIFIIIVISIRSSRSSSNIIIIIIIFMSKGRLTSMFPLTGRRDYVCKLGGWIHYTTLSPDVTIGGSNVGAMEPRVVEICVNLNGYLIVYAEHTWMMKRIHNIDSFPINHYNCVFRRTLECFLFLVCNMSFWQIWYFHLS